MDKRSRHGSRPAGTFAGHRTSFYKTPSDPVPFPQTTKIPSLPELSRTVFPSLSTLFHSLPLPAFCSPLHQVLRLHHLPPGVSPSPTSPSVRRRCMAASLLAHEVSDLCIGKPPLRPLPLSATVGEALLSLKLCGESYLSVWAEGSSASQPSSGNKGSLSAASCAGKVCMVDVICYLCKEENRANPSAALNIPVSALLAEGSAGLVRLVGRHSSVLEALDVILNGAQNLMVPLRGVAAAGRKWPQADALGLCWLTQEAFVRFFLDSISAFSPVPALSVDSLGLVRPDTLAVGYDEPALSAVALIKAALVSQTAVAIVTGDGRFIGEISPSTLAGCDETVAAAVATVSAGELMAYLDCGGDPPEEAVAAVKARLRERGMKGMLELVEEDDAASLSSLSSGGSSGSSSLDEELAAPGRTRTRSRMRSAPTGRRRTEEAVVCHRGSSLVAVMMQALAHRVSYVWVVEEDYELAGVVTFTDVLKVFRELLQSFQL